MQLQGITGADSLLTPNDHQFRLEALLHFEDLSQKSFPVKERLQCIPCEDGKEFLGKIERLTKPRISPEASANETANLTGSGETHLFSEEGENLIRYAFQIAEKAHKRQFRKFTGEPYFTEHTLRVSNLVVELLENAAHHPGGLDQIRSCAAVVAGALLHDVVEDSEIKLTQLLETLRDCYGIDGVIAAGIVAHLSKRDYKLYPGEDEKEQKSLCEAFALRRVMQGPIEGVLVKLCDRYANLLTDYRRAAENPGYAVKTYAAFKALLRRLSEELPNFMKGYFDSFEEPFMSLIRQNILSTPNGIAIYQAMLEQEKDASPDGASYAQSMLDPARYVLIDQLRMVIPTLQRILELAPQDQTRGYAWKLWQRAAARSLRSVLEKQRDSMALEILETQPFSSAESLLTLMEVGEAGDSSSLLEFFLQVTTFGDDRAVPALVKWSEVWDEHLTKIASLLNDITSQEISLGIARSRNPIPSPGTLTSQDAFEQLLTNLEDCPYSNPPHTPPWNKEIEGQYQNTQINFSGIQRLYDRVIGVVEFCLEPSLEPSSLLNEDRLLTQFNSLERMLESYSLVLKNENNETWRAALDEATTLYSTLNPPGTKQLVYFGPAKRPETVLNVLTSVLSPASDQQRPKLCISFHPRCAEYFHENFANAARAPTRPFFDLVEWLSKKFWTDTDTKLDDAVTLTIQSFTRSREALVPADRQALLRSIHHTQVTADPSSLRIPDLSWFLREEMDPLQELIASTYVLTPKSKPSGQSVAGVTPPIKMIARVRSIAPLDNLLLELLATSAEANTEIEDAIEIITSSATLKKMLRITLITNNDGQAEALTTAFQKQQSLESLTPYENRLVPEGYRVLNFNSACDDLSTGSSCERLLWLWNEEPPGTLIEVRIIPKDLLEDDERRFQDDIFEKVNGYSSATLKRLRDNYPDYHHLANVLANLLAGQVPENQDHQSFQITPPGLLAAAFDARNFWMRVRNWLSFKRGESSW